MQYDELIADGRSFAALREECGAVFDIDQSLPSKVFRHQFERYCVFEHANIRQRSFATFLTSIADICSDEVVNYMTLRPDPIDYYYKNCGFYGVASFKAKDLAENYLKVMGRDGKVDSFFARGGDVGVFWGSSKEWGIFCDRISWEICLMGFSCALDKISGMVHSLNSASLRSYISKEYQHKPQVAQEFLMQLMKNYPMLEDSQAA